MSAVGILGIMAVWRTYYATFLDWDAFLSFDGARGAPSEGTEAWQMAAATMTALALAGGVLMACTHVLSGPGL